MRIIALKRTSASETELRLADQVASMEEGAEAKRKFFGEADFVVCSLPGTGLYNKFMCSMNVKYVTW